MSNEYETLMRCVRSVRTKTDFVPKVALVLGSGLGDSILCKADYPFFMIITRNITCNVEHRMLKYSRNQK